MKNEWENRWEERDHKEQRPGDSRLTILLSNCIDFIRSLQDISIIYIITSSLM